MRIRKGDEVQVLSGKDRGQRGEVIRALPTVDKVIVGGVNTARRHTKSRDANTPGGIMDKDMPIHVSSVALVCKSCGPTRIGMRIQPGAAKVRICRKCGGEV